MEKCVYKAIVMRADAIIATLGPNGLPRGRPERVL